MCNPSASAIREHFELLPDQRIDRKKLHPPYRHSFHHHLRHSLRGQWLDRCGRVRQSRHRHGKHFGTTANQLVLGQVKTDEKSNEITAIPKLLRALEVKGCIVTIDAASCQKSIAAQIRSQEADYVLALKGNQGTLREYIEDYFTVARENDFHGVLHDYHETTDGDHGRVEIRRHWIIDQFGNFPGKAAWKALRSIGMVESERHIGGEVTTDRRYYISSLPADAKQFASSILAHWGVENGWIGVWMSDSGRMSAEFERAMHQRTLPLSGISP